MLCFVSFSVFYSISYAGMGIFGRGSLDFMPGPRLLSPLTDDIDLSGKENLEFKWMTGDLIRTDYFDFRLYKGYNTTARNLIFKQRFSVHEYPIKIPASQFKPGQVYTWVLVQVFIGGQKSDKSFSSFKITKKWISGALLESKVCLSCQVFAHT